MTKTNKLLTILFIAMLPITACMNSQEVEEVSSTTIEAQSTVTESVEKEEKLSESLTEWLGHYEQSGDFKAGITGKIELNIYEENDKYYGYMCVERYESETRYYCDERILTEIRGNQDQIEVYFLESKEFRHGNTYWEDQEYYDQYPEYFSDIYRKVSEAVELDLISNNFEKNDLLFCLQKEAEEYYAVEGVMMLVKDDYGIMVSGFTKKSEFDRPFTFDYLGEQDKDMLLEILKIAGKKEPLFYSWNDPEGKWVVDLYFDKDQMTGWGICLDETRTGKYLIYFPLEFGEELIWEDTKFDTKFVPGQVLSPFKDYQEFYEYDSEGRITRFYSEGLLEDYRNPPIIDKIYELKYSYRDDGTLEQKYYYFNPFLGNTTRSIYTSYYDLHERIYYTNAYITHGSLSDYYVYEGNNTEPSYILVLDFYSDVCNGFLSKYKQT